MTLKVTYNQYGRLF